MPPNTTSAYVLHIAKKHTGLLVMVVCLFTVWELVLVSYPIVIQQIIDQMLAAGTPEQQAAVVRLGSFAFFVLLVVLYTLARLSTIFLSKLSSAMVVSAASEQLHHVSRHAHGYFTDRFAGSINGKLSSSSDGLQQFVTQLFFDGFSRVFSTAAIIIITGIIDWRFAVLFSAGVTVVFFIDLKMVRNRKVINQAYSKSNVKYRGKSVDVIGNASLVRQFSREQDELGKLGGYITDRRRKLLKQVMAAQQVVMMNNVLVWIMAAITFGTVYILFNQGQISIGQIVLVVTLLVNMSRNINGLGNMLANFGRQYVDIQNGLEDIFIPHEIIDHPSATTLTVPHGAITLQSVTFAYQSEDIFTNLSVTIPSGQRVGLVGPSGAGKSTFVSLLLRQHDIQSGSITIDEQNIAQVTQDSLRQNIALVPQEPLLFHRTIRENILYGKLDATEAEMVAAAQRAQAHDFITTLPDGYDTLVGERGVKLSGGQKQRVAIARAMLKEAPVLILDEATSALDSESEVAIQAALSELMNDKTVIAVAHRLSTLREMDRILVFDNGQIIEDGSHDELTQAGGLYATLWAHQAGGFLRE